MTADQATKRLVVYGILGLGALALLLFGALELVGVIVDRPIPNEALLALGTTATASLAGLTGLLARTSSAPDPPTTPAPASGPTAVPCRSSSSRRTPLRPARPRAVEDPSAPDP